MAARIYSERFLKGRASSKVLAITVPVGKRAVVRFITLNPYEAGLDYLSVDVGGVTILYLFDLTPFVPRFFDVRAVAYAGEDIGINYAGADLSFSVQGFLFADS